MHPHAPWVPFLWRALAGLVRLTPEPIRTCPPNTDTHMASVSSSSRPLPPALGRSHVSAHRGMDSRARRTRAGRPPSLSDSLLEAGPRRGGSGGPHLCLSCLVSRGPRTRPAGGRHHTQKCPVCWQRPRPSADPRRLVNQTPSACKP